MIAVVSVLSLSISSCQVFNKYQSPEVDTTDLYRAEYNSNDTTTVASLHWSDYFIDPTLQKLIEEGLSANFDLRTAYFRVEEAAAALSVARAAYFPTAGIAGQATHSRTSEKNGVTDALGYGSNRYQLGLAVQWEIDIWGKLNRRSRASLAQYLQSIEYKRLIQTTLISNIAASYFTLMALDEQLHISLETIEVLKQNAVSMQAMMDAGLLTAAAVEQSRALLASTQVSALNLEVSIRKLENALSIVVGRKPGAIDRQLLSTWTAPSAPLSRGVPAQMLALRPDVRTAELQLRSAFELRNAAQAALYPSLTLTSGTMVGYGASSFSDFFKPENLLANVIGGLTQPLFAGNQLRAQVKITKAQEQEALTAFEKATLTAAQEVSDVLFVYDKAQEKTVFRREQIESLRKSVDYTGELLSAGEATYLEVLTARQSYLTAQLASVNDTLEKAQAVIDLYRALGGGGEN
ncbi:MAG: efflux transporter outer membrane subunit [Tannerella sp.]|nr:efflux transporter outer membrane subunit [Tannerella sp.]